MEGSPHKNPAQTYRFNNIRIFQNKKQRAPEGTRFDQLIEFTGYVSAFSDSACRAGSFASTAGYANIGIDVVLCIALGNSSNGAAISASTARYASVRNYICHKKYPPIQIMK